MIAVSKPSTPPAVLQKNGATWTKALCEARKEHYDLEDQWEQSGCVGSKPKKPAEANAKNDWYGHSEIRTALETLFHHKCAYCEGSVKGHEVLHIEHYRPQSIYPALAYDWDNLLVACGVCNRSPYKEDRFPLGPEAQQAEPNRDDPSVWNQVEEALLIQPCLDDPAEYFVWHFEYDAKTEEWTATQLAKDGNLRGLQTIAVCGLARVQLIENYREHLGNVKTAITLYRLASQFQQGNKRDEALQSLRNFVAPRGIYSAMTRAFLQREGFSVESLQSEV